MIYYFRDGHTVVEFDDEYGTIFFSNRETTKLIGQRTIADYYAVIAFYLGHQS